MCLRTRESAFSWCSKKSIRMHDDRTGSLLEAVSLSVNDRVDCHLKHHSTRCKSKVHFDTIVLNSSKTSSCCSNYNVRITLLLPMALKRKVQTINSSKCATDEIIETMFIPYWPLEVSACISTQKCVVRFETECSRGARISFRLSTILLYLIRVQWSGISHLNAMHFKKLIGCIVNQEIN